MAMFTLTEIENELQNIIANTSRDFFQQSKQDVTQLMRKQIYNLLNYLIDNDLIDVHKIKDEEANSYDEPGAHC